MEKPDSDSKWFQVENIDEVYSPSLLIYPDRIEQNIQQMIRIAGGPENLRPHVKTHKMPEIIMLQMKHGISKFKCSTIAETEMVARCGAKDILLAMQPVGPNLDRFFRLKREFINSAISCLADNTDTVDQLSAMAEKTNLKTAVWLDINAGMNRTGIIPGSHALDVIKKIKASPFLVAEGLHVYDGHIHEHDLALRKKLCRESFEPVSVFLDELSKEGISDLKLIAGGTPSFPVHAEWKRAELSPGTLILWDYGYSVSFTDMEFLHAAVLLTRVVSKPAEGLLCLDLGHKAVASEMAQPRVKIIGLEDYTIIGHNEEHMVIKTPEAVNYKTGDHLYCIPWHICPTVDRHDTANVIRNNRATGQWNIEARRRKLTY